MDERENHCLYVKRPCRDEPPIHYTVTFQNTVGQLVRHSVFIAYDTPYYEMIVKGRFVITEKEKEKENEK